MLSIDGVSFTITCFFSLFLYIIFWHPSGKSYFVCRICYFYQVVFFCLFFGIRLENLICLENLLRLSNCLSLCAFICIFCFSSSSLLRISMTNLILSYDLSGFSCFWIFIPFFSLSIDISHLIVSISFSVLMIRFGFLF